MSRSTFSWSVPSFRTIRKLLPISCSWPKTETMSPSTRTGRLQRRLRDAVDQLVVLGLRCRRRCSCHWPARPRGRTSPLRLPARRRGRRADPTLPSPHGISAGARNSVTTMSSRRPSSGMLGEVQTSATSDPRDARRRSGSGPARRRSPRRPSEGPSPRGRSSATVPAPSPGRRSRPPDRGRCCRSTASPHPVRQRLPARPASRADASMRYAIAWWTTSVFSGANSKPWSHVRSVSSGSYA